MWHILDKKSLKIPKGQSESVYQRTDNTMTKRKMQKDKQQPTKHTYKTSCTPSIQEHPSSSSFFNGVREIKLLDFYVEFCRSLCSSCFLF